MKFNFNDYGIFLAEQERMKYLSETIYGDALNQIRHHLNLHPKDRLLVISVITSPNIDQEYLKKAARHLLNVNIEYRILGKRMDPYGNLILSCIIRK